MQTVAEISGISCKSFVELVRNEEFRGLKIAEINACGALHAYLKDHPNLCYSECWVPHANPGEVHEGVQCEDLQCLTYPDNYFDIILTSETLEHVPEPDKAWHEIYRTLKGDGYHIFTIPVIPWQRQTFQRARLVNGLREDLLQPAYHGASVEENMFVYTDFGMDVVEKLNKMGLNTEVFYVSPEVDLDVAMVFRSHKTGAHAEATAKGPSPLLEWTGERYLPWLEEAAIGYEHLHRYAYATPFVQNKRVLDLACGEGYGSYLLAKTARSVVGIDIDENSIKHARNKYIKQSLEFKVGSVTEVPIAGEHLFEVIVCFEALEHIEDHQKLLSEMKRLLTPDGIFIVSTPNKTVYTDEPQYNNPFHVHELYFDEFRELFEKHFKNVRFLGQRIYCNSNIWPVFAGEDTKAVEYVIDRNPKEFVFVENDKRVPLYFIAIASDTDHEIEDRSSALIDVSDALLKQKDGQIAAQAREHERLGKDVDQLQLTVESQQQALSEKDEHANRLAEDRDRLVRNVTELQAVVGAQQQALVGKDQQVAQKEKEVTQLVAERERVSQQAFQLQATLQSREQYIGAIEDSLAWTLLVKYKGLRNKFFPDGTRRRKIYNSIKNSCKKLARGRVPAPQPMPVPQLDGADALWSQEKGQSIGLPDDLQQSAPKATTARSILARPEKLILAKLSVVIPTKNGMSEGFESTLRAISRQIGIAETEIIIVDSGSSDGTVEAAKNYGAKVFSIPPEEFNHGTTRNYAAEQSTGDLLVFTVQDAVPATQDLFYEMAEALLADSKLAGLSVRQVPKSDADIYACWEMWNHYRFLFEGPPPTLRNPEEIDNLSSQQLRRLAGLDNVCAMVRRQLWERNRFKATPFAEDLEFGLSCVRQGYGIGLLSHRGVIHSHMRSPFYTMSRYYVGMLVLPKLFKGDSRPAWVEVVNDDQVFSSVKAMYMAINEFAGRLDNSFARNPALVLTEFLSFLAGWRGTIHERRNQEGERTLDRFFREMGEVFKDDYPAINPCKPALEGTINSILQFLADRYPALAGAGTVRIMYKAFALAAGGILGEYCFWKSELGIKGNHMQMLDNVMRGGMQA
jgi:2-polyprenyl-3-methyl-5-hydroxy-6-metoxy-1,4-benzoquinol methylase/glycosyltransferase involved in cell wall biosynthesis